MTFNTMLTIEKHKELLEPILNSGDELSTLSQELTKTLTDLGYSQSDIYELLNDLFVGNTDKHPRNIYIKGLEPILEADVSEKVKLQRIKDYLKETYAMNEHQAQEESVKVVDEYVRLMNPDSIVRSSRKPGSYATVLLNNKENK